MPSVFELIRGHTVRAVRGTRGGVEVIRVVAFEIGLAWVGDFPAEAGSAANPAGSAPDAGASVEHHAMTDKTASEPGEPSRLLNALVAATLDDLDEGRVDLEAALHALARAVWQAAAASTTRPRPH
jgi:hypothetical protein